MALLRRGTTPQKKRTRTPRNPTRTTRKQTRTSPQGAPENLVSIAAAQAHAARDRETVTATVILPPSPLRKAMSQKRGSSEWPGRVGFRNGSDQPSYRRHDGDPNRSEER